MIRALLLISLLGGCTYQIREPAPAERAYTKAEVDAINAEAECRRLARTPLQALRCGPNERR